MIKNHPEFNPLKCPGVREKRSEITCSLQLKMDRLSMTVMFLADRALFCEHPEGGTTREWIPL